MKKIFLALLLLGFCWSAEAQFFKFGLKAGVNFTNYTGGNLGDYDFKNVTNFHGGLVTEFSIFRLFSIQPELLYISQGSQLKNLGEQFKDQLGYLAVPVMAKFYITEDGLSIEAGPQVSFLVSERKDFDLSDTNSFEFGIAGGIGLKFSDHFFLHGRYVAGLTDVKKNASVKNSNIMLSLGFLF